MIAEVQQAAESFDPTPWVCGAIVGATVLNFIFRGPPSSQRELKFDEEPKVFNEGAKNEQQ